VATARGQGPIQGLVHMKHRRMEISGLLSNQIVKSKKEESIIEQL
jgi:hypothetical protein